MAKNRSIFNSFLLLFGFFNIVQCLFEDQVGKFDWKQSYIGTVKFASFDSSKRVVIATEENVLASLNLKNGQIAWRHVLEEPDTNRIELLHVDKDAVSVSGDGNTWYVRGWDINNGMYFFSKMCYLGNVNTYLNVTRLLCF